MTGHLSLSCNDLCFNLEPPVPDQYIGDFSVTIQTKSFKVCSITASFELYHFIPFSVSYFEQF